MLIGLRTMTMNRALGLKCRMRSIASGAYR